MEALTTTYGPTKDQEGDFIPPVQTENCKQVAVRAKFKCNSITDYGSQKQAHMTAVSDNSTGENADFTKWTPYGDLKINIDAEAPASSYFKPGKTYYLIFRETE